MIEKESPLAHRESPDSACLNCGSSNLGAYCVSCGQKAETPILPFHRFVLDFLQEAVSVDGRLLASLRRVLGHPGGLTEDFLSGKRAQYVHPLRLFLGTGFFVLIFSLALPIEWRGSIAQMIAALFGDESAGLEFFLLVSLIPVLAITQSLTFFDLRRFFIEHLVQVLHAATFVALLVPLEALAYWILPPGQFLGVRLSDLPVPTMGLIYWFVSLRLVFGKPLISTIMRGMIAVIGALLILVFLVPRLAHLF